MNFLYSDFRLPCYICLILLFTFYISAYSEWTVNYESVQMDKATLKDMLNPYSDVGIALSNGTLQNAILNLIDQVNRMKTSTGVFLVFVCLRMIQLCTTMSRRLDKFARTALLTVQSISFYLGALGLALLAFSSCCALVFGDVLPQFNTLGSSIMTVILTTLKDPSAIDLMHGRDPNFASNIYILIMIVLKFIMFYIFFSIVYAVYMQVESQQKYKVRQLEQVLEETHWTNRLKLFIARLKSKIFKSKPPADIFDKEERRRNR